MDLEGIMFSEIRQKKILYDFTYMQNLKKIKQTIIMKQKQTHRYREQISGYQRRESGGRGKIDKRD